MTALFSLLILVAGCAGMWLMFKKAGMEGWEAIIPIYNTIKLLQIAGKPWWWIFLFCIPVVNIILQVIMQREIALKFGKESIGFLIGLILLTPIFYCILGFDESISYKGTSEN